jgi:hypothetical protein
MGELKYPIYSISVTWSQGDYQNNGTSYRRMYKEKVTLEQVTKDTLEWWSTYVNNHILVEGMFLKDRQLILTNIEVKYVEEESWCSSWFSHYTYNIELSDEELERSFATFVDRKLQDKNYCLMGAEDGWRRKKPCRCEGCQKLGRVLITH